MISTHTPPRASPEPSLRILIVSAASFFIDYMAYAMMVPLTPVSPAGIQCTADESIIVFAYSIGLLIASANISRVCGRLSHRSQMLLGTGMLACALGLIGSATHLWVYIIGRLFQGVAAAITSIVSYATVSRTYPDQRLRMLAVILSAGAAGFIVGPVFGGLLFGVGSYGLPFLCFAFPVVILGLAQWRYLKDNCLGNHDSQHAKHPCPAGNLPCKTILPGCGTRHRDDPDPSADHDHVAATSFPARSTCPSPLKRPSIGLPAVLAALCAASWATLEALVPLTLYQDYAQTPQAVGTLFSANSIMSLLTSFLIVMFACKVSASQLAIVGVASSCAIFLALAWIADLYVLWLAVPLAGISFSVLLNASTAMFAERVDGTGPQDDLYRKAYGIFSIAFGLGYSVSSGLEYVCASFASFQSINLAVGCLFASLLPMVIKYRSRARHQ